ncbi:ABC transporter F family member 4-like [Leptopilina heterotoma]|uniref:ABC transporter F family member 4-like n=1 Tax=Leptopilina heterotoma TaxID=63436 RepID=UPI001CA9B2E8|nr:ABC transporter F family member 4-like [Leptopilina heterotoma]
MKNSFLTLSFAILLTILIYDCHGLPTYHRQKRDSNLSTELKELHEKVQSLNGTQNATLRESILESLSLILEKNPELNKRLGYPVLERMRRKIKEDSCFCLEQPLTPEQRKDLQKIIEGIDQYSKKYAPKTEEPDTDEDDDDDVPSKRKGNKGKKGKRPLQDNQHRKPKPGDDDDDDEDDDYISPTKGNKSKKGKHPLQSDKQDIPKAEDDDDDDDDYDEPNKPDKKKPSGNAPEDEDDEDAEIPDKHKPGKKKPSGNAPNDEDDDDGQLGKPGRRKPSGNTPDDDDGQLGKPGRRKPSGNTPDDEDGQLGKPGRKKPKTGTPDEDCTWLENLEEFITDIIEDPSKLKSGICKYFCSEKPRGKNKREYNATEIATDEEMEKSPEFDTESPPPALVKIDDNSKIKREHKHHELDDINSEITTISSSISQDETVTKNLPIFPIIEGIEGTTNIATQQNDEQTKENDKSENKNREQTTNNDEFRPYKI